MKWKNKIHLTRVFKPEYDICPFCGSKIDYCHAVSNKVIQFSTGEIYHTRNLGYRCSNTNCKHNNLVFTSTTANKYCERGYTYSSKLLLYIYYQRKNGISRKDLQAELEKKNIVISDRNIDNIYKHYKEILDKNYDINKEYEIMNEKYDGVYLSIDFIKIKTSMFISIRDMFSRKQIGLFEMESSDIESEYRILSNYILNKEIKQIATVRKHLIHFKLINQLANKNVKFIIFEKNK